MMGMRVKVKVLCLTLRPSLALSGRGHLGPTGIYDIKAGPHSGTQESLLGIGSLYKRSWQ